MFRTVEPGNTTGPRPDADGNYAPALQIMWDHPTVSSCKLVHILKEHRIKRSREWIRKHRCDPLADELQLDAPYKRTENSGHHPPSAQSTPSAVNPLRGRSRREQGKVLAFIYLGRDKMDFNTRARQTSLL